MSNESMGASLRRSGASAEEVKQAAAAMGSVLTDKKVRANAEHGFKVGHVGMGGRPRTPLAEIVCNCDAGAALDGHRWDCPRGQAVKRREKAGKL